MIAENMLAKDKALYVGHAVAAVCAVSPHIAEQALAAVEVDYEVLPTVLTWREAMADNATLLHDDMTTYFRMERFARGDDTGIKSNVAGHIQHKIGDVEEGFADSDIVIEREFETQTVHQGYIEPHVSTAMWSADGRVTVWTSTQGLFNIRAQTAAILSIPESQVKVVPMEIGGGFGAKAIAYLDPVAAVLSKKTGRPVKISMDRKEVFEGSGPTSATFYALQDGRQERRTHGRRSDLHDLRSRRVPGLSGGRRRTVRFRPVQDGPHAGGRPRRRLQQAESAGIPCSRPAPGRIRC